jgi:hypothetical protein
MASDQTEVAFTVSPLDDNDTEEAQLRLNLPRIPSPSIVPEAPRPLPTPPPRGPYGPLPEGPADTPPKPLPKPPRPRLDAELGTDVLQAQKLFDLIPIPQADPRKSVTTAPETKDITHQFILSEKDLPEGSTYPTDDQAKFARKFDFAYGKDFAKFLTGDKVNTFREGVIGQKLEELLQRKNLVEADLLPNQKERMANFFTKAAIAIQKMPIAAVGFDPNQIGVGFENGHLNVGGAYHTRNDVTYSSSQLSSNVVHEAVHRGLNILENSDPELKKLVRALPDDELAVRYLMHKQGGDPEGKLGTVDKAQRLAGIDLYKNGAYNKIFEALDYAAQQMLKKRRPGGPR